ncbi:MAG: hypothetical protein HY361_01425, partial [Candidatus Aenigmarchaeota archaeon]|nr:hypothetical protein [Candidatus Aenigmarchaeota archaeon]
MGKAEIKFLFTILLVVFFSGFVLAGTISTCEVSVDLNSLGDFKGEIGNCEKISGDFSLIKFIQNFFLTITGNAVQDSDSRTSKVFVEFSESEIQFTTTLPEEFNIKNPDKIKILSREKNEYVEIKEISDTNGNGIYDSITWISSTSLSSSRGITGSATLEFSEENFDIIIITDAEHLDSDRNFISDIYEEVKELDGVWSETIENREYVRVTFEVPLTKERDITIFPRIVSGNPKVEIYEENGNKKIAEFESLNENEYNKVFLDGLEGKQDTFDLRVVGGSVELDHVIDPDSISYYNFTSLSNRNAYWSSPASSTPFQTGTNATASEYTSMQTRDATYAFRGSDNNGDDPFWRFNFTINEDPADVTWIYFEVTGNENGTGDVYPYVYNFSSGTWYNFATIWSGTNQNFTRNFTGNINATDFVEDSTGKIVFLVESTTAAASQDMFIDFVQVQVGYQSLPTSPTNITCDSGNCNITVDSSVVLNASGSTDADGDSITYFIEAEYNGTDEIQNTTDVSLDVGSVKTVRGTTTIASGSATRDVTIGSVNTSSAFLVFSTSVNNNTPERSIVFGNISNSTNIHFEREAGSSGGTVDISWYVAEFDRNVNVQSGAGSRNIVNFSIPNSVNLSSSFPISSFESEGSTAWGSDDEGRTRLTNSTNVQVSFVDSTGSDTTVWQAVDYSGAKIQNGTFTLSSGSASNNVDITAVNLSKAFVIATWNVDTGVDADDTAILVNFTDSDTIHFERTGTTGNFGVAWYVVEFTGGEEVQTGLASFSSGETQKNITINSVNTSRVIAFSGGNWKSGKTNFSTDDNLGHGWFIFNITNSTNLQLKRAVGTGSTADVQWFVVKFGGETNTSTTTYNDLSNNKTSINNITVKVEVDSYDPRASVNQSTTKPDLWLEIHNGSVGTGVEGTYTGTSFDTAGSGNGDPEAIVQYNDFFWITDITNDQVFKHWTNGTYTGTSFDTAGIGNAQPKGITYYNDFFWITDQEDAEVYRYWTNGTYSSFSFDISGQGITKPNGITYYNDFFWITDGETATDEVYKYWTNGTYTGTSFDTAASGNGAPEGIIYYKNYFWITDYDDSEVYKYYVGNLSYANSSFDTNAAGNNQTQALVEYNGFFWIPDTFDDEVYKYETGLEDTWISIGAFNLTSSYTGNDLNTTNANFSLTTTDSGILSAWQNSLNQDIRIKGVYLDRNGTLSDEINYTNVYVTIDGVGWIEIGSHNETSTLTWNTSDIIEQNGIDLRARAIDLTGSNTYSSYFTKNSDLEIRHQPNPTVNLYSPANATTSSNLTQTFMVNLTDNTALKNATLHIYNSTSEINPEGVYTGNSLNLASGNGNPNGITNNETYFWVTDYTDKLVYQYWLNGTYTNTNFSTTAANAD